ncbi:C2 domain-containing protein [Cavenderia fasciculata]|uniref:C2 domain-containing protein n=1 Tax=Cavenderia fasciculata TaxID=261658 RepID=F4PP08_CACFS|nr:C2 domain-containing protein [Cavenderia fasciculata]EGG22121.1 C2 domain-containing protein [Cavenderia fasciculata]|eukprot:XP_004359972.1 C2 domain-containing protein [Cavenderia fasciculata]
MTSFDLPKDYYGKLFIKIVEARNTLALDITGTSDPYCLITLLQAGQEYDKSKASTTDIYRTETIYKTLNPQWHSEEYVFDVLKCSSSIFIEIWDEDKLSKDDRMGQLSINIDEYRGKGMKDVWLPIQGKKASKKLKNRGDIRLQILFQSYETFIQLLNHEQNIIPKSISKTIISDEFTKSLLYTLSTQSSILSVISDILTLEINSTIDPNVLFRTDSLATKLTVTFFKLIGFTYLKDTLQKHILNIIINNITFEVDPSKGVSDAEVEANFGIFLHHCQIFLDAITVSGLQFPDPLRFICNHIYNCVEAKFPLENNNVKSVGGFIFLRFINPALFSPDSLKLIANPPNNETRRSLTLITKILQNISNQVIFSSKEKFLERSNSFISGKAEEVGNFLIEVSKPPTKDCRKLKFDSIKCETPKLIKYFDTIITSIEEKHQLVLDNMQNHTTDQDFITSFTNEVKCISSLIKKQQAQSLKNIGYTT